MRQITFFVFALTTALFCGTIHVSAQTQVVMTTSRAQGESLSFTVNRNAAITVDWGDGNAVSLTSTEGAITGNLKGAQVTIGGDALTFLDCSDAGLTALDISKATGLNTLYCSDNSLQALSLSQNKKLVDLDCSNNQIGSLSLTNNKELVSLNCSYNKLIALSVSNCTNLKQLICGNNELTALIVTRNTLLNTLWCENNAIKSLLLSSNPNLETVYCSNNQLTKISEKGFEKLIDFWCDNNLLEQLSFGSSANLQTLSCENNLLSALEFTKLNKKALAVYCGNNALDFSSFFTLASVTPGNYFYGPQHDFLLSDSVVNIGDEVLAPDMSKNGEGTTVAPAYRWYDTEGNQLTKGTASGTTGDFSQVSNAFRFKKAFSEIYCQATSVFYPNVTLKSKKLKVMDPTVDGIGDVAKEKGFTFYTDGNSIWMTTKETMTVRIYTFNGQQVWSGTVDSFGKRVNLPKGVYLVNDVKVTI